MAMRCVVVAENMQRPQHLDARRLRRHQHHALLSVARRIGVGAAHDDVDLAARVAGARTPPLATVDHIVIAVALDAAGDVGGVGRGDLRLGHEEGRADLAAQQRLEPAVLQRLARIALERLHVAGVGRRAVEDFGGERHASHDLAERCVLEVGKTFGCTRAVRQEQVPEAGGARFDLQALDDFGRRPGLAGRTVVCDLLQEHPLVRIDMTVHEGQQLRTQGSDAVAVFEIHVINLGSGKVQRALSMASIAASS